MFHLMTLKMNMVSGAYERTKALLIEKKESAEILALELLKKEILFQTDLERLIGKRPFDHKTTYEEFMDSENSNANEVNALVEEDKTKSDSTIENTVAKNGVETSLMEEHPPKE